MARTKQTAKKSIVNHDTPRKQLATKRAKGGFGKGKHVPLHKNLPAIKNKRPHKKGKSNFFTSKQLF